LVDVLVFSLACGQTHFDQKNPKPNTYIWVDIWPPALPNTCVDTGLLNNKYVIIDNILVSKN